MRTMRCMDPFELREPDRVRRHSSHRVNARIDAELRASALHRLTPEGARAKLTLLDREWDLDRAVMATFAVLGGTSFALGLRSIRARRKANAWLALLGTQLGFLLAHAVVGWCPPVPVLRRLGFRTAREIEAERHAVASRLAP
jgi:hypothetical protein